jgi:hypothetical protein
VRVEKEGNVTLVPVWIPAQAVARRQVKVPRMQHAKEVRGRVGRRGRNVAPAEKPREVIKQRSIGQHNDGHERDASEPSIGASEPQAKNKSGTGTELTWRVNSVPVPDFSAVSF